MGNIPLSWAFRCQIHGSKRISSIKIGRSEARSTDMSATAPTPGIFRMVCTTCSHDCEQGAKFCSECGTVIDLHAAPQYVHAHEQAKPALAVPNFAPVPQSHRRSPNEELRVEANKLMILLARERIFLYMHWAIFLGLNLFGFWMAMK